MSNNTNFAWPMEHSIHYPLISDADITADGSQIVFASQRVTIGQSRIFRMDADGENVIQLTRQAMTEQQHYPTFSPDGQYIAYEVLAGLGRINSEIVIIDSDDGEEKMVFEGGQPSWFDPAFAVDPVGKLAGTWGGLKRRR